MKSRRVLLLLKDVHDDRPVDRIARGCPACACVASEHCKRGDASAAIVRHCPRDRCKNSLLGSTEDAEVNGGKLLSHGAHLLIPGSLVALAAVRDLSLCAKHLLVAAIDGWVHRG
jgi:hypothetical protein